MRSTLVLLLAGFLLCCFVLGVLALIEARQASRLRQRVLAVAGTPSTNLTTMPVPSIRVAEVRYSALQLRFFWLVGFSPDLPRTASVIPWPVIAVVASGAGLVSGWRLAEMMGTPLGVFGGVASAVLTARGIFKWQTGRYRDAIFQQLPEALGLMVRAIRAGLPLAEALRGIASESSSPLKEEFTQVVGDIAIGRSVDAALMRGYARTGVTEFSFLAVTLGLQAQTGGSLAETLDTLAGTVRKRVAMTKRASALAAEGRMQAGLLAVLPFLAGAGMSFIQPFYLRTFIENPTGQRLALTGLGLMLLGMLTIRHLIRSAGRD